MSISTEGIKEYARYPLSLVILGVIIITTAGIIYNTNLLKLIGLVVLLLVIFILMTIFNGWWFGVGRCEKTDKPSVGIHEKNPQNREVAFVLYGVFAGLMGGVIGGFLVQSIYNTNNITEPINCQILIASLLAFILVSGFLLYYMWKFIRE